MLDTEGTTNSSDMKLCSCCGGGLSIQGYAYICNDCFEKEGIMNTLKKDPRINQRIEIWARWLTAIFVILIVMLVWHWSGK